MAQCHVSKHVKAFTLWRENFCYLWIDSYGEQGLNSWIVQSLNQSDGKLFSLRSRVVVHDAGTVMCVESRGRLVGVRWARAVREGGASV